MNSYRLMLVAQQNQRSEDLSDASGSPTIDHYRQNTTENRPTGSEFYKLYAKVIVKDRPDLFPSRKRESESIPEPEQEKKDSKELEDLFESKIGESDDFFSEIREKQAIPENVPVQAISSEDFDIFENTRKAPSPHKKKEESTKNPSELFNGTSEVKKRPKGRFFMMKK